MGRKFRVPAKRALDFATPPNEGDNQEEKPKEKDNIPRTYKEEVDYSQEQYPPADDKYKQLEDRLNAMEIQRVPGLDFEDLGLVLGVVISLKFKVPIFAKYDGVFCPKLHLRSYVRKIQPHTTDRKLWVHFFQESLADTQLDWFYQLEGTNIHTWEDLVTSLYKQYQYNTDLAPTRVQLQNMSMGSREGFKEYAQKQRDLAGKI